MIQNSGDAKYTNEVKHKSSQVGYMQEDKIVRNFVQHNTEGVI